MNCSVVTEKLSAHLDGDLSPAEARTLETHLAVCPSCRRERDALRTLVASARDLPTGRPPARDLWPEIESQLSGRAAARPQAVADITSVATRPGGERRLYAFWPAFAVAASFALLITLGERHNATTFPRLGWDVAPLSGTPRVDSASLSVSGQLFRGQWLETDATSRALVSVGSIGEVNLEPNSRLRLVDTSATDHRLELARGTLRALIWAPPRLFFVNTPSATAVDLGCAYTLAVDEAGNGELHVTGGYVALEAPDRESIVPAEFMCFTRPGAGPGTPFALDAPPSLKAALHRLDFPAAPVPLAAGALTLPAGAPAPAPAVLVTEILTHARPEDAITLWHLLTRVSAAERPAVYDALAARRAPPAGVTRAGILAGDSAMRHAWAVDLGLGAFARR